MATRQVILSDISGAELTDETHAKVIVKHPDMTFAVELDMSTEEAEKLQNSTLRLVNIVVHEPNKRPREVVVETRTLDKVYGTGVKIDEVLAGARKANQPAPTGGQRAPRSSGAKGDKVDPTAPDQFGRLRRGRLTEAEKELVRANREQASANRVAQGHPPINFDDPKERERYGITD